MLLQRVGNGDESAAEDLLPIVYAELRRLAASKMASEPADHTLQPTALVHEAYLRLVGRDAQYVDRAHFFRTAALAMRRILVERARRVRRIRHGGALQRTQSPVALEADATPPTADLLALDAALERLDAVDPHKATVAVMRFVLGYSVQEVAEQLGVSPGKIKKDWLLAKAWLKRDLGGADGHDR